LFTEKADKENCGGTSPTPSALLVADNREHREHALGDFKEAFVDVRVAVRGADRLVTLVTVFVAINFPARAEAIHAPHRYFALHSEWALETSQAAALTVEGLIGAAYALSPQSARTLRGTGVCVLFDTHAWAELARRGTHGACWA